MPINISLDYIDKDQLFCTTAHSDLFRTNDPIICVCLLIERVALYSGRMAGGMVKEIIIATRKKEMAINLFAHVSSCRGVYKLGVKLIPYQNG